MVVILIRSSSSVLLNDALKFYQGLIPEVVKTEQRWDRVSFMICQIKDCSYNAYQNLKNLSANFFLSKNMNDGL